MTMHWEPRTQQPVYPMMVKDGRVLLSPMERREARGRALVTLGVIVALMAISLGYVWASTGGF